MSANRRHHICVVFETKHGKGRTAACINQVILIKLVKNKKSIMIKSRLSVPTERNILVALSFIQVACGAAKRTQMYFYENINQVPHFPNTWLNIKLKCMFDIDL